jgi:hypothetical protein
MNKLLPLLLCVGALGFAGCESMSSVGDRMGERFHARSAGVTKVYAGQQRDVHAAAKTAVGTLGFKVTRSGAAQGTLEAMSSRQSENGLKGSRQVLLKVYLEQVGEGVQVRAAFSEVIEDDFNKGAGMGTETPLYDTPLYEVYFRAIEKLLPESALAAPVAPAAPVAKP